MRQHLAAAHRCYASEKPLLRKETAPVLPKNSRRKRLRLKAHPEEQGQKTAFPLLFVFLVAHTGDFPDVGAGNFGSGRRTVKASFTVVTAHLI
jgi:hypothetical protein